LAAGVLDRTHASASGTASPQVTPRNTTSMQPQVLLDGPSTVQRNDTDVMPAKQRPPSRQASLGRYSSTGAPPSHASSTPSMPEPDELLRRLSAAHLHGMYPSLDTLAPGVEQVGVSGNIATAAAHAGSYPGKRDAVSAQAVPTSTRSSPRGSMPGSPLRPTPPTSASLAAFHEQPPVERGPRHMLQRVTSTGYLAGDMTGTGRLSSPRGSASTKALRQSEPYHMQSTPVVPLASIQSRMLQQPGSSSMHATGQGTPMYRRSATGVSAARDTMPIGPPAQRGSSLTLLVGSALADPGVLAGVMSPSTRRAALLAQPRQG
jgi:hypothetical protein